MTPLLEETEGVKIVIRSRDHLPPHIHAIYGDDEAVIEIRTGRMIEGHIPGKKLKVVQKWLSAGLNRKQIEINFFELNPGLISKHHSQQQRSTKNKFK